MRFPTRNLKRKPAHNRLGHHRVERLGVLARKRIPRKQKKLKNLWPLVVMRSDRPAAGGSVYASGAGIEAKAWESFDLEGCPKATLLKTSFEASGMRERTFIEGCHLDAWRLHLSRPAVTSKERRCTANLTGREVLPKGPYTLHLNPQP